LWSHWNYSHDRTYKDLAKDIDLGENNEKPMKPCTQCGKCCIYYRDGSLSASQEDLEPYTSVIDECVAVIKYLNVIKCSCYCFVLAVMCNVVFPYFLNITIFGSLTYMVFNIIYK